MSEALAVYTPEVEEKSLAISRPPEVVLAEAQKAAAALAKVISGKAKPVKFNNEVYLEFEDWQVVGRFYGISVKIVSTTPVSFGDVQGWEAKAEAIHASGTVVSAADSMCLNDEPNWRSKPMFMLRSMAQTRACAKALRNVLAWVVVLAGYRPTPAEEMDGVRGFNDAQQPQKKPATKSSAAPVPEPTADEKKVAELKAIILKEQARLNVKSDALKTYARDVLDGRTWAQMTSDDLKGLLEWMVANYDQSAKADDIA